MEVLEQALASVAADASFSGAVRVERRGRVLLERAYGFANRAYGIRNRVDTRFALASGAKGLTALVVASLLEDGVLELGTPVRSLLARDLPLVDDRVTIEQLLAHRSGIGDYLDEDGGFDPRAYVLPVPVQELATTEDYLRVLDGHPQRFPPGTRFAYCNSGYVVLALAAERSSGTAFHELVAERVCRPAGMSATAFLRSDELPGSAAIGYLDDEGLRTNVLHLPVRGSGDGGVYSTVEDISSLWRAFFAGRIVGPEWVAELVRPRSEVTTRSGARYRYGLGFWLHESAETVSLEGYDAGVSFRSAHDPIAELTYTVVSNTTDGAFPLHRRLAELLL